FVFLSDRPTEHAQTLTFMVRAEARHIAWEVAGLAALKELYAAAKARGLHIDFALNHRVSLSLYLRDPEGNAIELYWPTGQSSEGLYAEPLDLEQPDAALLALIGGAASA